MRWWFALLLALLPLHGLDALAAPPDGPPAPLSSASLSTSTATNSEEQARASLDALLEHMVRAQFGRCPGVEVHKRGNGFIAGRFGGPVVLVTVEGGCSLSSLPDGGTEAFLHTRLATRLPGSSDEIAVLRRTVELERARCPANYLTPLPRREVAEPSPGFCDEAFTSLREPLPLADFFHPVLAPLGTLRLGERNGIGAVVLERAGRSFELQGTLTCQPVSNELEGPMFGRSAMRSLHIIGNLTLRDVATGDILGRWHEPVVHGLGINCAVAFGKNNSKMATARTSWRERIVERIDRAGPLPSTPTPP